MQSSDWTSELLAPGTVFAGKFAIKGLLAASATGALYEVEHVQIEERFALKIPRANLRSEAALARFVRGARAASRLTHPATITVREMGMDGAGTPYLVTDLAPGEPLDRILARGPLAPWRAAAILRRVLDAIVAAHRVGIAHGGLEAADVVVELLPDGLDAPRLVALGSIDADPDPRAEVCACGRLLQVMLAGLPARRGAAVPRDLADLVARAVGAARYERRFESVEDLAAALEGVFSERFPGLLASEEPIDAGHARGRQAWRDALLRAARRAAARMGGGLMLLRAYLIQS